jgi:hypothetical protein
VDDDGLVEDQSTTALVIPPDALRPRIGGGATVHVAKRLHRLVHPVVLIDGRLTVALDARNEEHDQSSLSAGNESVAHAVHGQYRSLVPESKPYTCRYHMAALPWPPSRGRPTRDLDSSADFGGLAAGDRVGARLVGPRDTCRTMRNVETCTFGRERRFVAKFGVADLRVAHADEELAGDVKDLQAVMG